MNKKLISLIIGGAVSAGVILNANTIKAIATTEINNKTTISKESLSIQSIDELKGNTLTLLREIHPRFNDEISLNSANLAFSEKIKENMSNKLYDIDHRFSENEVLQELFLNTVALHGPHKAFDIIEKSNIDKNDDIKTIIKKVQSSKKKVIIKNKQLFENKGRTEDLTNSVDTETKLLLLLSDKK